MLKEDYESFAKMYLLAVVDYINLLEDMFGNINRYTSL
jgi:hypothetical protein